MNVGNWGVGVKQYTDPGVTQQHEGAGHTAEHAVSSGAKTNSSTQCNILHCNISIATKPELTVSETYVGSARMDGNRKVSKEQGKHRTSVYNLATKSIMLTENC